MRTVAQKGGQNCDLIEDEKEYRCIEVGYTRIAAGSNIDANGTWISYGEYFETRWSEFTFSYGNGFIELGNSSTKIEVLQP